MLCSCVEEFRSPHVRDSNENSTASVVVRSEYAEELIWNGRRNMWAQ